MILKLNKEQNFVKGFLQIEDVVSKLWSCGLIDAVCRMQMCFAKPVDFKKSIAFEIRKVQF